MQSQSVCDETLPWLISVSLDFTARMDDSTQTSFRIGGENFDRVRYGGEEQDLGSRPPTLSRLRSQQRRASHLRLRRSGSRPAQAS